MESKVVSAFTPASLKMFFLADFELVKSEPFRTPKGDKGKDILFTSLSLLSVSCLLGFFKKRHARLIFFHKKFFQLLFSSQLLGRSMRNQKFSAPEKMLSTSLVSSNYWHAKVPCSSCLVLARLCSVGKDLSST